MKKPTLNDNHWTTKPQFLTKLLFWIFMACLALGQLQRIQLTPQISFFLHECLMIGIIGLTWFPQSPWRNTLGKILQPATYRHLPHLSILMFALYVLIQTIVLSLLDFQVLPLLYLLRLSVYLFFIYTVKVLGQLHILSSELLKSSLIAVTGAIAVFGLAQYLLIPDTRFLFQFGWDDHYFRLISTLFDPNYTAVILVLGLLFVLMNRKKFTVRHLQLSVLFLITMLLTYSRAGYLAFVAGMVTLAVVSKRYLVLLFIPLLLFALPFLPRPGGEGVKLERTASITARLNSNQDVLQSLTPLTVLFGQGAYRNVETGKAGTPNRATTADNSYLFILQSVGVVGMLLLIPTIQAGSTVVRKNVLLLPLLLTAGTHALFNNTIFYPWVLLMLPLMCLSLMAGKKRSAFPH
jgi:hypothetical protein